MTQAESPVHLLDLATLVVRAGERAKADFAQVVMAHDVPPPLARAILLLGEPAPMGCLASQMSCDQSYVTRLADDLVKRGLVTRAPGDDRRVQVLSLTPAGIALKNELVEAVASDSTVVTALTPAEQEELRKLLTRILNIT